MNHLLSLPKGRRIAALWAACGALASPLGHAAGTLTVTGTLTPQGSANYCIYSAMSDDGQGNWQVGCGGTGSKTITFTTPLSGQLCTSFSSLAEDSNGNWTVANCVSAGTPATIYYVHTDNLGTPRLITRPTDDAVTWRWDNTEAFGNSVPNENPSGLGAFHYNFRFPGQYYDQETATHYNYYRDYDPNIGRYLESDPIGLMAGTNTFSYVGSRPLRLVDPDGLNSFPLPTPTPSQIACAFNPAACPQPGGAGVWWNGQTPAKKCEYKCTFIVGSPCKFVAKRAPGWWKAGVYLGCEGVIEYGCGWYCEHEEECKAAWDNFTNSPLTKNNPLVMPVGF